MVRWTVLFSSFVAICSGDPHSEVSPGLPQPRRCSDLTRAARRLNLGSLSTDATFSPLQEVEGGVPKAFENKGWELSQSDAAHFNVVLRHSNRPRSRVIPSCATAQTASAASAPGPWPLQPPRACRASAHQCR